MSFSSCACVWFRCCWSYLHLMNISSELFILSLEPGRLMCHTDHLLSLLGEETLGLDQLVGHCVIIGRICIRLWRTLSFSYLRPQGIILRHHIANLLLKINFRFLKLVFKTIFMVFPKSFLKFKVFFSYFDGIFELWEILTIFFFL